MSIWSRLRSLFGETGTPGNHQTADVVDDTDTAADTPADTGAQAATPTPVVRVNRDSEVEAAARLRIAQVERALRAAGERDGESSSAEPPWARGKNRPGRLPSGPGRPHDAAFVLTVVLASELPNDAATLSSGLDCAAWPKPQVRLIPLMRNGIAEPGFAAQVTSGERRAFIVYRQTPYATSDGDGGSGHVGLLIGGPGTKPSASDDGSADENRDEGLLAPLVHALLVALPDALGVVWNRHEKLFRPRAAALTALETAPGSALEIAPGSAANGS